VRRRQVDESGSKSGRCQYLNSDLEVKGDERMGWGAVVQLIHPKLAKTVQKPPRTTSQAAKPPSGGGPGETAFACGSGADDFSRSEKDGEASDALGIVQRTANAGNDGDDILRSNLWRGGCAL
jgi:hypothetical protein